MPGRDGTGPNGEGPGTGWGMGPCVSGSDAAPLRRPMRGRGRGRGPGRGLYCRWYPEDDRSRLEALKSRLENDLKEINERLGKL